jgi:hypothetical protein
MQALVVLPAPLQKLVPTPERIRSKNSIVRGEATFVVLLVLCMSEL